MRFDNQEIMMQYNLYYENASIIISLLLMYYFGKTKKSSGFQNRIFMVLIICNVLTALFDVANKTINVSGETVNILNITTMGYFLTHLMILPLLFFYVLSSIKNWYELTTKFKFFILLPITMAFIVLLTNPLSKYVFHYEDDGSYVRGPGYIMLYLLVAVYACFTLYLLFYYRQYFSFVRKVVFIVVLSMLLLVMGIQAYMHNMRVETFGITYSLLLMFFVIQNPKDQVDTESGLYNMDSFREVMGLNIASGKYFNLVEIIISDFDEVKTEKILGKSKEEASVPLACQIGNYLKELSEDITAYRIKNNLFCIEMENTSEEDIIKIIRNIRKRFTNTWNVNGYEVTYKIKMCHIAIPEEIDTFARLMGVINGSVSKDLNKELLSVSDFDLGKLERLNGLNAAILNGLEENSIEVVFSPVCEVKNRTIVSTDTSVRLFDSSIGYISKDEILEFAEKNGKIGVFSRIQFEKVCDFIKENNPREMGLSFVGIELTSAMCHQVGFVDYMIKKVEELNINPDIICFKISEYTFHMAPDLVREIMDTLHNKGFKFALNDYGSGFTNIASVYELNFDIIKISDKVVREAMVNDKARITLESSFDLAKDLGMNTVAAGIDDEKSLDILANTGCEFAIGKYFLEDINSRELVNILVAQENIKSFESTADMTVNPLGKGGIA